MITAHPDILREVLEEAHATVIIQARGPLELGACAAIF